MAAEHGMLEQAAHQAAELARALAPETERSRALAPALVAQLKDTGLLRAALPSQLGGPGAEPAEVLATAETVAGGDASAGWCVSINATSSLLAGYLPEPGAAEVFGDPRSVACGVWAPQGVARAVSGGVVVSGRWSFCSGITHSDWMFGGATVHTGAGPDVARVLAMPVSELTVLDTWDTGGLRGTGSHDAVADELFVPSRRLLSVLDGPPPDASACYRFPIFGFFALSIAAAALGNARGAIGELVELAGQRRSLGSSRTLAERSTTQEAVAAAEAALRAARLLVYSSVAQAWRAAAEPEPVPDALRAGLRLAATHATRTAAEVTRAMYDLGGGAAIYADSPLQRRFRDAHTATAHFQVNATSYQVLGRLLLGLSTRTEQL
ncbi:MAG TPA: acyl-CoA dehydrogenase family protein [Pseudonocardia sp.]|uniref:acyl-CoA dehydrogenase family protein n=1 Tax=Pseudonocardia sp. TaxID=60912 RepID=UPI002F405B2B